MDMAHQVNIHEAKTKLSQLLVRVAAGEEVIIAKAGKPVARLSRIKPAPKKRTLGGYEGTITIAGDFDTLPDDLLAEFEKPFIE